MSISAADWIENTTVDHSVFDRWPNYQATLVASDGVDIDRLSTITDELFAEAHATARHTEHLNAREHIQQWHKAFRDFGVKPRSARTSVDALLLRAETDEGLPRINTLVDLYNSISMITVVPIGGEDLDSYVGPARLVLATGDEPFLTRSGGEVVTEHPKPGEPVWVDDEGVTCRRWNWRQTSRTAIHDGTRRVGFIIDSLDGPEHAGARDAATRLAGLLGEAVTRVLSNT
jgi:DNA/RNA-binding domain of Phe-tRNA-synthetase-like protein